VDRGLDAPLLIPPGDLAESTAGGSPAAPFQT
jgi:hypothetical protein